jgi:hypothetical protein
VCSIIIIISSLLSFDNHMNTSKKIGLIAAVCITIVYEVILFTTLIGGAYRSQSLSIFFTFLFSLAGAAPIVIILIIFGRDARDTARRYGEVGGNSSTL